MLLLQRLLQPSVRWHLRIGWLVLFCFALLLLSKASLGFFSRQTLPLYPDAEARAVFQITYDRLRQGSLLDLSDPLTQLQNYPLAPYLEFQLSRNQLAYRVADIRQIESFLQQHADWPFAPQLRQELLQELARRESWSAFLRLSRDVSLPLSLECQRIQAQAQAQGKPLSLLENALEIWLNNQPLPSQCEPVTQLLDELGFLDAEAYWHAASTLMHNNQSRLAWQYANRLTEEDRQLLDFWRRGQLNPENRLTALMQGHLGYLTAGDTKVQAVVSDLLQQHISQAPEKIAAWAETLRTQNYLSASQQTRVLERIALHYAARNDTRALDYFAQISASQRSAAGHEWYARSLLRQQQWIALAEAIKQLPPAIAERLEWQYWLAQAYLRSGQNESGLEQLSELAKQRHYYGFLAARELGLPPAMNAREAPMIPYQLDQLNQRPGIQRAAELYFTGFDEEAQREWLHALRDAEPWEWQQAAWLAKNWGFPHLAVQAAHRAGLEDALELRFPLAYLDTLTPLARIKELDLALILALIRKESLFNPQARSRVGALGLMQIMPATGQSLFQRLQLPFENELDLLHPEHNLQAGVLYLAELLARYDQDPILAAAAYNAGSRHASRWLESHSNTSDPLWVEQITFGETRDYVKSLLAFREVYAWRLQQTGLTLATTQSSSPEG